MTDAPTNDLPNPGDRLLDKFRIERVIGQGGAGIVYAARHELLDQPIALKVLLADRGSEAAARFVNEAKLAAKIRSEHVCRVMDVGHLPTGLAYIAMEYLEGHDLDAVVARGRVPVQRAVDYVLQATDAIAQAHGQGIIHRDLKPANLFLASNAGHVEPIIKVLDFGISKAGLALGVDANVTSSRAILGSPSYMSPEQIKNARTVDLRTDIWSLGVILYELVTGVPPFGGETVGEVFAKILEASPPPMGTILREVPAELDAVVTRCLARDREQRYANVGELARALEPFASEASAPLIARIERALAAGGQSASMRDSREAGTSPKRTALETTTLGSTSATTPSRRRGRIGLAASLAVLLAGGGVFFLSTGYGSRGDVDGGATVDPSARASRFEGILDAIANVVTSLGSDAGAPGADDTADASAAPTKTPSKDAGRTPGAKTPGAKTPSTKGKPGTKR